MRYEQFRDSVRGYLQRHPEGATWAQLREELQLPYRTPCYTWIYRMEDEVRLQRARRGSMKVWKIARRSRRNPGARS